MAHSEPEYFQQARQSGKIVVTDPPKLDLEAYIDNYKGRTRFDRLILIGTSSPYLSVEALKAAIVEAKQGKDVKRYEDAVGILRKVAPNDRDAALDAAWVDRMSRQVKAETDRLEQELKGYKNNLIKESIRMAYEDIGQHYSRIGELPNSAKAFNRMREYSTTPSHVSIMTVRIIISSIDQGNWMVVQSNVQRLRTPGQKFPEADKMGPKLSAAMGISHLAMGNYKDAAKEFLDTDPRMIHSRLSDASTEDEAYGFPEAVTPNDIAVYGGLCALASMSRDQLQRNVLNNSQFRNFLELEPHIRRAISSFVSSKYAACLSILDSYKTDYLLDIHLQRHLLEIYRRIRGKAIQQYFIPFSCVTLFALGTAFNTSEEEIEREVTGMIKRGDLDARVDLVRRVLLATKMDGRSRVHEESLAMAKDYERTLHLRILRMEILNAGLEVKLPKGQGNLMSGPVLGGGGQDGLGNGTVLDFVQSQVQGSRLRSGARA